MNLLDAAYHVAHDSPGGVPSLAPRLGKSTTALYHELKGVGTAKLGLIDAERITDMTGDMRILEVFAANMGQMLVPLPDARISTDDCMVRLGAVTSVFGELCHEVASDLMDGSISDNELKRINEDCGLLIAKLHGLQAAIEQRNQDGKPAFLKAAA
jgi:hypothetical protein